MRILLIGGSKHYEVVDFHDPVPGDEDAERIYQVYDPGTGTVEDWIQINSPDLEALIKPEFPVFVNLPGMTDADVLAEHSAYTHLYKLVHTPPGTVRTWNTTVPCVDKALSAHIDLSGGRRAPVWNGKQWIEFRLEGAPVGVHVWHLVGNMRVSNTGCIFTNIAKRSTNIYTDINGECRRYHEWLPNFYFTSQWIIPQANNQHRYSHPVEGVTQS